MEYNKIFNIKRNVANNWEYSIGVDTCNIGDKPTFTYILLRKNGDSFEFLAEKSLNNKDVFKQQVAMLSELFNAKVIQ